jgi:pimeloyl-ACP methyl ester carboxylesterase
MIKMNMTSCHISPNTSDKEKKMSLTIQGVNTQLTDAGTGSPILFLHGAPDSGEMWNKVIEPLKKDFHCFTPDLPGFGRSTAPGNFKCSLDNMARFIDELVEGGNIPTPLNLVVTDFGATYGLAWAVKHPEKIRRLAIAGSANFSSRYQWHQDARLLRIPLLGELGMATLTLSAYEKAMHRNAPLLSTEYVRQTYAHSLAKPGVRRMMIKLYRSIDPKDFIGWEEHLRDLTTHVPTLVLWGDKDPYITPDYAEQFGSAQVEHFPQNGHWLAVEIPETVTQRLATFFG